MEVYVIRHTPVLVGKDICYGQTDVELSDSFEANLQAFTEELPQDFDAVFCSPLKRCAKLAEGLSFSNVQFEKDLLEMNFGDWENKAWNDLNQDELNNWMSDFVNIQAPSGENLIQLSTRVDSFLEKLRNKDFKKVLLITHAGVIHCIWGNILGIQLKNIFKIPVLHGEIFIFKLGKVSDYDQIKQLS